MARVSRLHVASRYEIWRLETKLETTLRIVPVEQVSDPNFRVPVAARISRLQMREDPGRCTFIVRGIEIEIIESREIDACEQAARAVILHAQVELVLRRMRLFAAIEVAFAKLIADITRLQQRGAQI